MSMDLKAFAALATKEMKDVESNKSNIVFFSPKKSKDGDQMIGFFLGTHQSIYRGKPARKFVFLNTENNKLMIYNDYFELSNLLEECDVKPNDLVRVTFKGVEITKNGNDFTRFTIAPTKVQLPKECIELVKQLSAEYTEIEKATADKNKTLAPAPVRLALGGDVETVATAVFEDVKPAEKKSPFASLNL